MSMNPGNEDEHLQRDNLGVSHVSVISARARVRVLAVFAGHLLQRPPHWLR